jgi:hypothetical protein
MTEPTSSRRTTKKKKAPRASFVVTVGLAVAASACNVTVVEPDDCPSARPTAGDSCEGDLTCDYSDACSVEMVCGEDGVWVDNSPPCNPPPPEVPCAERLDQPCVGAETCEGEDFGCGPEPYECVDGAWTNQGLSCNPPPPCPVEAPAEGTPCEVGFGPPVGCVYAMDTACGPAMVAAECVQASPEEPLVWEWIVPTCTPTEPACASYANSTLCQADATCRWLTPGCGDTPSDFPAGCYAADDCDPASCTAGTSCTTVIYDPCFDSNCNACAADAQVCL